MSEQFLVVVGNPVDGVSFFGPFASADEASTWCECGGVRDSEWWVAPITGASAT